MKLGHGSNLGFVKSSTIPKNLSLLWLIWVRNLLSFTYYSESLLFDLASVSNFSFFTPPVSLLRLRDGLSVPKNDSKTWSLSWMWCHLQCCCRLLTLGNRRPSLNRDDKEIKSSTIRFEELLSFRVLLWIKEKLTYVLRMPIRIPTLILLMTTTLKRILLINMWPCATIYNKDPSNKHVAMCNNLQQGLCHSELGFSVDAHDLTALPTDQPKNVTKTGTKTCLLQSRLDSAEQRTLSRI